MANLNSKFGSISKNSKSLAMAAMQAAAQRAFEMSVKKAETCLQQYYRWTPSVYRRTGTLKGAIKPHAPRMSGGGKTHSITFSIEYNSSLIEGAYQSNSWYHQSGGDWKSVAQYQSFTQDNGTPDSGWIVENYLHGIHPRYVGTPQTGIVNKSVQDGITTMTEMTKFFQGELPGVVSGIIQDAMSEVIWDFLKI